MMKHIRLFPFIIVIVAISVWFSAAAEAATKDSVESFFQKARQEYLQKDMKAAAAEVRKGAARLKSEAAAAADKEKKALTASSRELEKLAGELEKGTVKSVKEMDMAFARAYEALATNSRVKSAEAWSKKEYKQAGDDLEEAIDELVKGFAWAGQEIEVGTQKAIDQSKELSKKLKEGASWASAEANKAMKDLENEISAFGRRISRK